MTFVVYIIPYTINVNANIEHLKLQIFILVCLLNLGQVHHEFQLIEYAIYKEKPLQTSWDNQAQARPSASLLLLLFTYHHSFKTYENMLRFDKYMSIYTW